jgi:hypothetical protein
MSLTVKQFTSYAGELFNVKKSESFLALAIATNPHIKPEDQHSLWDSLKDRASLRKLSKVTEAHRRSYEQLERILAERKERAKAKVN